MAVTYPPGPLPKTMISYFIFTRFSKLIDLANLRIYSVLGKISNKVLKKVRFKNEFMEG
jgi:hypothetical protein